MKVRIFRQSEYPDILRQLPGYDESIASNRGKWGDIEFIHGEDGGCDFAIILDRVGKIQRTVFCSPENVWVIMQEPFLFHGHDYMIDDHNQYARVYTHHIFNDDPKYVRHFPILPWFIDKTYDELKAEPVPEKTRSISWITSNKADYPGHKERVEFIEEIKNSDIDVDLFGRGICPIGNKWDGLAPYKYSLVVENSSSTDYWTEKLSDCFLGYSLPIYYGCTNIDEYFPKDSYIRIDIREPDKAIEIIKATIKNGEWEKRLDAIKESRQLVLEEYNMLPYLAKLFKQHSDKDKSAKQEILLHPFKRSLKRRVVNRLITLRNLFS